MSNESSASETTPLRRPESQCSEDVTNSPAAINNVASSGLTQSNTTVTNHINNNNNSNNNHNNNNNNIIEERLDHNINIDSSSHSATSKMDTNKRILIRIGLDVLVLICVGCPILGYFLWGVPYKRGFFCDDESLKHPFKNSSVASWMLYVIGLVIPVSVIMIVEIIQSKYNSENTNSNATPRRYVFLNYEVPSWLFACYKKIGIYGFGAAVSQLATDIAKYSIGRLRPHFFAVCHPVMSDGTTCEDRKHDGEYITDFICNGKSHGSTDRMLKEVRLSFPSGHSSFTFYAMVYMALYLQSRMTWRGSKLLRHFLQFMFLMVAWYTALSRVSDYKHHWSDVLAGSSIGAATALIVANFISDLFQTRSVTRFVLPRTTQDDTRLQQTITTNGH